MRRPATFLVTLLALVGVLAALPPSAAVGQETVTATIGKKATLVDDGQAVLVTVTVACAAGSEVLEAFVYVTQDGNTSQFAGIPVVCDGTAHTFTVRVPALDSPLHLGKATASGYVLVTSGTGTASASPTATITIRR
jgi:hypothetical protein